jgi:hypothetical protein
MALKQMNNVKKQVQSLEAMCVSYLWNQYMLILEHLKLRYRIHWLLHIIHILHLYRIN